MEPFLGSLLLVPYNFAPQGWLLCQGQLLPISQYTALFSLLGTTYGGDGRSTFGLPDLRGRVPISAGQGPGLQDYVLGQVGGTETATLSVNQLPAHNHSMHTVSAPGNSTNPSGHYLAETVSPNANSGPYASTQPNSTLNAAAISPTGGGHPVDILQPYLTLNWIIAFQGVYPSRA